MPKLIEDQHLGGFMEGGDKGTFFPHIWLDLQKRFNLKSVIDIGCGEGYALRFFEAIGMEARGIDGSEEVLKAGVYKNIDIHDYTTGAYKPNREFDLAWSAEFLEHVEEEFIPNFMETFKAARVIALTHALPGQGGYHHVDEQPDEYWIDIFRKAGYKYEEELTKQYRAIDEGTYFRLSGLIFKKI